MRLTRGRAKLNNAGVSLIELIVVMALIAIIGTAFAAFLGVSLNTYKKNSADVNIQTQAQMASNQLENMILDASNGVCYNVVTDSDTGVSTQSLQLYSFDFDTKTKIREMVYKDNSDSMLYYTREEDSTGSWEMVDSSQLFATYVEDFDVIIYDAEGNDITGSTESEETRQVEIRFKYSHGGRAYQENKTVTLRNKVMLNADEDRIFDNIQAQTNPSVRQVFLKLNQDNRLWVGQTYSGLFSADMIGNNTAGLSTAFKYAFGNPVPSAAGTSVSVDGSSLTLDIDEKNNFEVIATSEASETIGAAKSAAVQIYPRYIQGGTIIGFESDVEGHKATFTLNVVVHNGVGDDAEKNEVFSKISQGLKLKAGGDLSGKLSAISCTEMVSGNNSVSYMYEVSATDLPLNVEMIYNFSGSGYSASWNEDKEFILREQIEVKGKFEVFSKTCGASGATIYPGETLDIYGVFAPAQGQEGDIISPIMPSEFSRFEITQGAEYFVSSQPTSDGKLTVKTMDHFPQDLTNSDKNIRITCEYKRGKHTYSVIYNLRFYPVTVKVVQPYNGGTLPLNVDAGIQGRELLAYMCRAYFVYDMPDLMNVNFNITVKSDSPEINVTSNSEGTESNIIFDQYHPYTADGNMYQADTDIHFLASISLKCSDGNWTTFDTGAKYTMKLTYGNPNVFTKMEDADWNRLQEWANRVCFYTNAGFVKPVFGVLVPTDLYGGRYLPQKELDRINSLYPPQDVSLANKRTTEIQKYSSFYNLIVEYDLPTHWENNVQVTPHYAVRYGGDIPSQYNEYSHNTINLYDYYNGKTTVLKSSSGGSQAKAGLSKDESSYTQKAWYEIFGRK